AINQLTTSTGVSAVVSGATLRMTSTAFGSDQFVSLKTLSGTFVDGKDLGADAEVNINGARAEVRGKTASVRNSNLDMTLELSADFAQTTGSSKSFLITGGGAKFQLGSEVNRQGQAHIGISSVSTTKLGDEVVGFLS